MPKDALRRRRDRRPAGFCQEQTLVLTEQFSSMERDAFHVSYLSDKIPEAVFHGHAVKTVAYLRVSTVQQDAAAHFDGLLPGTHPGHSTTQWSSYNLYKIQWFIHACINLTGRYTFG